MKEVVFDAELPLAAGAACEAVQRALATLCERSRRGEVSLAAAAVTAGGSEFARILVPVALEVDDTPTDGEFSLHIASRSAQSAFPRFSGSVDVEPLEPARSRVRLRGVYEIPFGLLGAAANAFALDSIARQSLRRLLEDLVAEAELEVREANEETYREIRRSR